MTIEAPMQMGVRLGAKNRGRTKPCGPPEFTSYRSSELSTKMIGLGKSELVRGMQPGPPVQISGAIKLDSYKLQKARQKLGDAPERE